MNNLELRWWERLLNWVCCSLGAKYPPFTCNYLVEVKGKLTKDLDMQKCNVCGKSDRLVPDHSGYHCNAKRMDGHDMMCLRCTNY